MDADGWIARFADKPDLALAAFRHAITRAGAAASTIHPGERASRGCTRRELDDRRHHLCSTCSTPGSRPAGALGPLVQILEDYFDQ
jgi:hypothetical protein